MVEQGTHKPLAVGSNPALAITSNPLQTHSASVSFCFKPYRVSSPELKNMKPAKKQQDLISRNDIIRSNLSFSVSTPVFITFLIGN